LKKNFGVNASSAAAPGHEQSTRNSICSLDGLTCPRNLKIRRLLILERARWRSISGIARSDMPSRLSGPSQTKAISPCRSECLGPQSGRFSGRFCLTAEVSDEYVDFSYEETSEY
jgi:hypothetical protein